MKIISALLVLSALIACRNPFGDSCACTLAACFEGVAIKLENNPDTALYSDFSVRIAYGDTTETESEQWNPIHNNEFYFSSNRVARMQPKQIGVRISYSESGLEKSVSMDSAIAWTSYVCNGCSGSSPSCKDDMASTAGLRIDLAKLLGSNP